MADNKQLLQASLALVLACMIPLGIVVAVLALGGNSESSNSGVFTTSTSFGFVQPDGSVVSATKIPRRPGTVYGWSLNVYDTTHNTRIQEFFVLPEGGKFDSKPKADPESIKAIEYWISEDGREQTEVFEVRSRRSFTVVERYTISDDDPAGEYHITLNVNGIEIAQFDFEVFDEG